MISSVLIVDDEPLARARLAALVRRAAPGATIREAPDGDAAVAAVASARPDACFLDIAMPARSGFEVIAAVGPERMPPVVFVTAYDEYALGAFDVAAVDYLLKPFDDARFDTAWRRLAQRCTADTLGANAQRLSELLGALARTDADAARPDSDSGRPEASRERLVFREGSRSVVLAVSDIAWLESDGNHVVVHASAGTHRVRDTLVHFCSCLDASRFVRIHRRFVVDVAAVRELRPWSGGDQLAILRDGARLPVSRNYRNDLARALRVPEC